MNTRFSGPVCKEPTKSSSQRFPYLAKAHLRGCERIVSKSSSHVCHIRYNVPLQYTPSCEVGRGWVSSSPFIEAGSKEASCRGQESAMVECWETGGCNSPSKDSHQSITPTAHHKPLGKVYIQSVAGRLQPEALPLAEGQVMRPTSVSLERGSPVKPMGHITGAGSWSLRSHLQEVACARAHARMRDRENKSGTCSGLDRAWS